MQKNKTHRVITISPSSANHKKQQSSHINNHNKTHTPIKPLKQPRNTVNGNPPRNNKNLHTEKQEDDIKTTAQKYMNQTLRPPKSEQHTSVKTSVMISGGEKQDRNEIFESIYITSYKDNSEKTINKIQKQPEITHPHNSIDDILNRIGNEYKSSHHQSTREYKEKKIGKLREVISEAKQILNQTCEVDGNADPMLIYQQNFGISKVDSLKMQLKMRIKDWFEDARQKFYQIERQLMDDLEQKIFQLKEKNITKCFQVGSLRTYTIKCEQDLDDNYEGIMNQLQVKDFENIVKSYTDKLNFYMNKAKCEHKVQFVAPSMAEMMQKIPQIKLQIKQLMQGKKINIEAKAPENDYEGSQVNETKTRISIKSLDKHKKGTKSTLEQLANIPFSKFGIKANKKIFLEEPRIASARGRY